MTGPNTNADAGGAKRGKMGRAQDKLDRAARGRWALPFLFLGSVLESTVFPWPIEFPMIAYMLRGKRATVEVVIVCVLGSVAGSLAVYLAGRAAFEVFEGFIMARPDLANGLEAAQGWIAEWGALAVAAATLAPIPVQTASLAAGLAEMAVWAFLPAIAVGRALRYGAMGVLLYFFGDEITDWWEKQPKAAKRGAMTVFILAFIALLGWGAWSLFAPG
ncbi:MAG: YqaA family protein [Oceanicaulis sp.]